MSKGNYEFLRFDVINNVAHMTFDSPATGNRYPLENEWELFDALARVQAEDSIHAVVVTGEGDEFGGGAKREGPFVPSKVYEQSLRLFDAWSRVDTPIVVALNAKAMLTLPLLSDIVIAERHVEFNDKHVLSGVPTATGSFLWPMSIGLVRSKRYLLTGDSFSAEEAERFGLVAEVVDTGASKTRATELAEAIAELDPTGVQMTKRALNEWVRVSWGPIFKHGMGLEFLHFPDRS